ncbi:MAG: hypothetical protein A2Z20_10875 [Bdellovibrionales bacterium RBG_16_40_8]|nr:MAG: hypothetical protein A2Z20_10875 [Bdellovibrionales bacterium RBG_16_40_8]
MPIRKFRVFGVLSVFGLVVGLIFFQNCSTDYSSDSSGGGSITKESSLLSSAGGRCTTGAITDISFSWQDGDSKPDLDGGEYRAFYVNGTCSDLPFKLNNNAYDFVTGEGEDTCPSNLVLVGYDCPEASCKSYGYGSCTEGKSCYAIGDNATLKINEIPLKLSCQGINGTRGAATQGSFKCPDGSVACGINGNGLMCCQLGQ